MKSLPKKALAVVLLAALLVAVGVWWLRGADGPAAPNGPAADRPVPVELAPVARASIQDRRVLSGTLNASQQIDVAPKIAGRVEAVTVQLGDTVRRGQVVARLDDAEAVQARDQAEAELAVARASLDEAESALALARSEHARMRRLRAQGIASEAELDQAQAELQAAQARAKLAQAQIAQRSAALKGAEVRLGYTQVRAEWEGGDDTRVVSQRFIDPGATIAANTPVVQVLELDPLIAVVNVVERDYVRLRRGQSANISAAAYGDRRFPAEVVRIAPRLDVASRQARVELRVPNPEFVLRPGMFVQVDVVLAELADVTVVPQTALAQREGQVGVFLLAPGQETVNFVPVRTGVVDGDLVQILEPALDGQVVTLGQHLLRDGARVTAGGRR